MLGKHEENVELTEQFVTGYLNLKKQKTIYDRNHQKTTHLLRMLNARSCRVYGDRKYL